MKKIIRGRKYDTETARKVGCKTEQAQYGDVDYALYRKRTGEYFVHAEFSYMLDDGNPDYIKPLSADEANEWAQKHLNADVYEAEFGEIVDDDETISASINLPRKTYDKLRRLAVEAGEPMSKYMTKLIDKL